MRRRGASAITVALSLTAILGAGAVVIDLGYQRVVGHQLQAGVDAAAIAAAAHLGDGASSARQAARVVAALNQAGADPITLTDSNIQLGTWNEDTSTFTVNASSFSAVRVLRSEADVPTFLGQMFGNDHLTVTRSAIATTVGDAVCGVLADTTADIRGTWSTDSYDSRLGRYGGTNVGQQSGVCSNGDLTATGTPNIYGGIHDGRDYGDTMTISGSPTITGSTSELPEEIPMPTVNSSYYRTRNNNANIPRTNRNRSALSGTSFSLSSTDYLTLPAGNYYFTSLSINGQASLRTNGVVNIYVAGDVTINGAGVVNLNSAPANLTIYVDGSRTVRVNGTSAFYGSIIAPRSAVTVNGTADYFGMLIANTANLSGTGRFHTDLAMVERTLGPSSSRIVLVQ